MKVLYTIIVAAVLMITGLSCQPGKNVKQILSKTNSRMELMDKIANSSKMSVEMMDVLLNGKRMTTETQEAMVRVVKDYPAMIEMIKSDEIKLINPEADRLPGLRTSMMVN